MTHGIKKLISDTLIAEMPFVRQMEKQFERGKKGQLISKKFAKSKVAVKITLGVVVDEIGHLASVSVMKLSHLIHYHCRCS